MQEKNKEKEGMKESKEYVSISTRLPLVDVVNLKLFCNRENLVPSEYIRNLIFKDLNSPKKTFLSGKNRILYSKLSNSFGWFVQLDNGKSVEVLNNLSDRFLIDLEKEIQEAIKIRNLWIHQVKPDSVEIPSELVGEKNEI